MPGTIGPLSQPLYQRQPLRDMAPQIGQEPFTRDDLLVLRARLVQQRPQLIRVPRLGDIAEDAPLVDGVDHCFNISVAGEHDAHGFRTLTLHLTQQLHARHLRHALISHDHMNRLPLENFERLEAIVRRMHLKLQAQQPTQRLQDFRLVIDHQNRMLALFRHRVSSLPPFSVTGALPDTTTLSPLAWRLEGQPHAEEAAAPGRAIDRDGAAVVADNTIAHGKTQSHPLAYGFRGKEGLEDMRHMFGLDTAAIIFDLNLDAFSRYGTGAQRQRAPESARLHGIHEQIEEDLVDFARVAQHRGQFLEAGLQPDLFLLDLVAGNLECGSECRIEVDLLKFCLVQPGEITQIPHNIA